MAFNFKTFAAVGALIGSLALVGCGQDEKDPNHIKVGVIVGAEQQVAEVAQKVAKEKYGLGCRTGDLQRLRSAERSAEQR
ncbi:methionine ABC transporter substrate-binding protein [Klebsiella michiganensis]|uniref:Methionine ABC transporter substrate-binding protein n=1 Tax=Klebsiella michiganensis TaxID=1134687 RepID=A0A7H4LZI8_9ENTR|nr:methionine ABC transporter substrate-binding protein [Klebsiella michiganensis]